MGSTNDTIKNQIIYYYLFHKQIENLFEHGYNPFYRKNNNNNQLNIEHFYVIEKNLVKVWKTYCNYDIYKNYFDEIKLKNNNIELYKEQMKIIIDKLKKEIKLENILWKFNSDINNECKWSSRNILKLEDFDILLNEKGYEYFKNNLKKNYKTGIKGIITNDKLILFYEKIFQIKFIFYGEIGEPDGQKNQELIQLTADFSKFKNGYLDIKETKEAYEAFKSQIYYNINYVFQLFENKGIRFLQEETINFSQYFSNDPNARIDYNFILKNENLSSRFNSKKYIRINYQKLTNNKFRLIGLANVGATCYMNATLQCFINVPTLTNYLLRSDIYKIITQKNNIFELSCSYCNLLYHVCCDENVKNYFEPNDFKNIIGWKNPLFKGINANDSKDLINFMLEEMNQELINLNPKINNNQNNNNIQINQEDKYIMLNIFKSEFSKNNNSIISQNFFFITETKTRCLNCKILKYNYQVLYLLEFPLELIFNFCLTNNIPCIDNKNNKYILLKNCFKQYSFPSQFIGDNQLYCNKCNKLTNALCQSRLYSLPKTLIIILNRGKGKIFNCLIDFPDILDLSKYVLCTDSINKYNLTGVITHLGESGMSGHFIAFCKHRLNGKWYKYNDAIVTLCQDQNNEYKIGTPYILFYEYSDGKNNVLFDGKTVDKKSFNKSFNNMNFVNNNNNINMMNNNFNNGMNFMNNNFH